MSELVKGLIFKGCHEVEPLQIVHLQKPTILPGQIWAKILLCTICGSDVHTLCGKRTEPYPSILGHEAVAEVLECTRDNCVCRHGDRITFCVMDCCQSCDICKNGYPQKCRKLSKYGHMALTQKSGLTGCYATHILLDANTPVFVIPEEVPSHIAAPINCSLATMVNATSFIPKSPLFKTALIQGAGLLGLYGCLLLKEEFHFTSVMCSDVNADRLKTVSQFGAVPVSNSKQEVADNSVDVVIEVCGQASVIGEGVRCLRIGGMYILVGLVHPDSKLQVTGEQIIRKCLTITGIHNYRPKDLEFAVQFVSRIHTKYPFQKLVSPEFSLEEGPKAFELAKEQKYMRVAIKPS